MPIRKRGIRAPTAKDVGVRKPLRREPGLGGKLRPKVREKGLGGRLKPPSPITGPRPAAPRRPRRRSTKKVGW